MLPSRFANHSSEWLPVETLSFIASIQPVIKELIQADRDGGIAARNAILDRLDQV